MLVRVVVTLAALVVGSPGVAQSVESMAAVAAEAQQLATDAQQVSSEGDALAAELARVTGVSMNPLLGMTAIGAWRWYTAPPEVRAGLPWHQQPWFWGACLAVLVVFLLADKIPGLRPVVKSATLFKNKASLLLSAPILMGGFANAGSAPVQRALAAVSEVIVPSALAASVEPSGQAAAATWLAWFGAFILGLAVAGSVWLLSQAIDVLILLSPFAPVDAVLRTVRMAILGLLVAAAAMSPTLGAAVALVIVVVSAFTAGWAFRLTVFGAVLSWDLITFRREGPAPDGSARAFATNIPSVPRRTWGTLSKRGPSLAFTWRPWLVFPTRTAAVPSAAAVGIGLLSPVLFGSAAAGGRELVRLPPRYRGSHLPLAAAFGLEVVEVPLVRGFRAALAWMRGATSLAAGTVRGQPRTAA